MAILTKRTYNKYRLIKSKEACTMARYIYGKCEAATVPQIEKNDFHSLSMFLGAYLLYEKDSNYSDFKDYAKKNRLLYKDNKGECFWSCVNKAHAFIRDMVNQDVANNKQHISRRQIRKLGHSGFGSVRMYPLNGTLIQDKMFHYVFCTEELCQVKELFLDFLYDKWNDLGEPHSYLSNIGGTAAVDNTFRKFIYFQYSLLSSSPGGQRIIQKLLENTTYKSIQHGLDERR